MIGHRGSLSLLTTILTVFLKLSAYLLEDVLELRKIDINYHCGEGENGVVSQFCFKRSFADSELRS